MILTYQQTIAKRDLHLEMSLKEVIFKQTGFNFNQMRKKTRKREVVLLRYMFYTITTCHKLFMYDNIIATSVLAKDHTSGYHMKRSHDNLYSTDSKYRKLYEDIVRGFEKQVEKSSQEPSDKEKELTEIITKYLIKK